MASENQAAADKCVRIRGARMHNLQNIDLDIPRDRLVVITGPSGSGKSSLAFDTLYAEGQRQYIESLSTYARQFLHQLERPDVDLIEGLQPTISIDQRAGSHNPRSTVATVTEIYDYLRLLYARLGQPRCHQCGEPIHQQSPENILDSLMELNRGTRVMILAPLVRGRKGGHKDVFNSIRKAGLLRARVDGEVIDVDDPPELAPRKTHDIEAVVDRVVVRDGARGRIAESVNLAIRHGDGLVLATHEEKRAGKTQWRDRLFSTLYACPNCGISFEELEPRTFSFNSPYGACPKCEGLGSRVAFDPELVVPEWGLSLFGGAVAPWRGDSPAAMRKHQKHLQLFFAKAGIDWSTPLEKLSPKRREQFFHGLGKQFAGVLAMLGKEYAATGSEPKRQRLETFRGEIPCPECGGARLRGEARSVRFGGKAIHEVAAMPVSAAQQFFASISDQGLGASAPSEAVSSNQWPIARPILGEIAARLDFLRRVGLGYLTLDRPAGTLSGGELQRVRLAAGMGSGLVGACYVLDEPSVGLHARDNQRLIDALRELQSRGNTVVVVEHDERIIRRADWLLDLGPGAGRHGGRVVARGTPEEIAACQTSLTGRYLAGVERIRLPDRRRRVAKTRSIVIEGATTNNLKDVIVNVPLSALVCVTGVSGSGKSSLIDETLARALVRRLGGVAPKPGPHRSLRGAAQIDKVVRIDQSPIGRTPRSNPATYTGLFDEVRKVFANTRDARQRGYKAGRFSFNVKGGRCEECQGQGQRRIEMNFLPDLYVDCPVCERKRFNRQTLEIRYRDRSIADVLNMQVEEATEFFENFPIIARLVRGLQEVGLGYMALGQPSNTLSGGEAQRVKLAAELSRVDTGKTLYILDEPTTGLHFDDVRKLLAVLDRLVELGNTVLVIEHNLDVIKTADWIIDLGPEGGEGGGQVVAAGTPEEIAALDDNHTGRFLRPLLS
ncbi:MAG: excinuclease ABC subunit UvrA [Planctomycetes bacterium]|nr:excinuclease ABC subunit UvrA [Planctomycetota bacterium]MBU4398595.1 excinuclease ABC subunit UvrA [Planctomycetota bacterium]MCG2685017.1 excinuclease ABC subunit UvrA [Planctomycetales bacterium]